MSAVISGKVIRGISKGKKLDFPTANIKLHKTIEGGIYAGSVKIGNKDYKAGIFIADGARTLEAHLIGFSGDLYGKKIEVEIGRKIRGVIRFKNDEELKKQIKKDIIIISNF